MRSIHWVLLCWYSSLLYEVQLTKLLQNNDRTYSVYEVLFEVSLVDREVSVAFPDVVVVLLDEIGIKEAHLHERLDREFQQVPVNLVTFSVFRNLNKQRILERFF